MAVFTYRHFGLTVASNEALPTLVVAPRRPPDVVVELLEPGGLLGDSPTWVAVDPPHAVWRATTESGSRLRLRFADDNEWAEFVIDELGGRVWVTRSADVQPSEIAGLLAGSVFSCVLAQRGITCVHAAVVGIDGRAVAVIGTSGAGKSTTATALMRRGALLIADDVAALADVDGRLAALPGPPRLRMRPDSASVLVDSLDELEPVWREDRPGVTKRYLGVDPDQAVVDRGAVPLAAVYFLARRDSAVAAPSVRPMRPADALPRLMGQRHMAGALDAPSHRRDFATLGRLARAVPSREVVRPDGLATVDAVADAIVADVASL